MKKLLIVLILCGCYPREYVSVRIIAIVRLPEPSPYCDYKIELVNPEDTINKPFFLDYCDKYKVGDIIPLRQ